VNTDWASSEFPPALAPAMTSLRELAADRPIDNETLLEAFMVGLAERTRTLRAGRFDAAGWVVRQLTNGRPVRLDAPDGSSTVVRALSVDPSSGALVVEDRTSDTGQRTVLSGEIVHLRLADGETADPAPVGV
jgi:biotin-(acetyl-CoA carboxylase) ligase